MHRILRIPASITALFILTAGLCQAQSSSGSPVSVTVYDRTRVDSWQWFAAPPYANTYGYVESLLRIGVAQRIHRWDWAVGVSRNLPCSMRPAMPFLPSPRRVSWVWAERTMRPTRTPIRPLRFSSRVLCATTAKTANLRLGRFEFFDGQEMQTKNPTIGWLQTNRIAHRLIGNFGFSNAQRSFDGLDAHYGSGAWNITAMAARADQGVFNMNGNPELNVDLQYLALTRSEWKQHVLWRPSPSAITTGEPA